MIPAGKTSFSNDRRANCAPSLAFFFALLQVASAQFYTISTVAGSDRPKFFTSPAVGARLVEPRATAVDGSGNIYLSDQYYHQVFLVSPTGSMSIYAGAGQPNFGGDGGPAASAFLFNPAGLAVDAAGNLYIADATNNRVRKVSPAGTITTFAGNGSSGVSGDGGSATSGAVGGPSGLALDAAGNLYISQPASHIVRMVSLTGIITTVAGTGASGFSGDGGAALSAQLFSPIGVRVDKAGNLYIADRDNNRIRKVNPQGIISTFAGNGTAVFAGDGSSATAASLFIPNDVVIDAAGNVYISDGNNARIRVVNAAGIISTFAGGGGSYANGGALQANLGALNGLSIDATGNIFLAQFYARLVRRVTPQQTIATVAGGLPAASFGDNVPATSSTLLNPLGVAADAAGNFYISDFVDNRVRKVSTTGIITTVSGDGLFAGTGDGGAANLAEIGGPRGLSLDSSGNLYVPAAVSASVRKIAPNGIISTIAGNGPGFSGDGGKATAAKLSAAYIAVADPLGNVYISDANNARIRRVDPGGIISTFAGTGVPGYSGDGGPAIGAQIFQPRQLALDTNGNLYVADSGNNRIRKITPTGTITTVVGTGVAGATGDGGPATAAMSSAPTGVAVDAAGNLFVVTVGRVRKVDASSGIINTVAGNGTTGFSGDGGLATNAMFDNAQNIAIDGAGNLYITDTNNVRVRKLTPSQIVPEGVANGATLKAGAVAPGEIVSIFGFNLGPATAVGLQLDANGKVATQLAGTQVLFDNTPAPLLFVFNGQINVVVPYGVNGQTSTQMQVIVQGKPTNTITVPVTAASPGLFAITNQDGSVNSAANPAAQGSVLVLYGTGEGQTNPGGVDGNVATAVFPKPNLPVSVQIGGQTATVLYSGAAPGFVSGVLQLNVQIPAGVTGSLPLQLQIGSATMPTPKTIFVGP